MNGNTKNSQIKYCPCPKFVFIKLKKKKKIIATYFEHGQCFI